MPASVKINILVDILMEAMLYRLTKRLGQILSLPLTLHHTLAPGLEKRTGYDPERHVYDNVAPEVSLMGVAIMILKMVYGFDGRTRFVIKEHSE